MQSTSITHSTASFERSGGCDHLLCAALPVGKRPQLSDTKSADVLSGPDESRVLAGCPNLFTLPSGPSPVYEVEGWHGA